MTTPAGDTSSKTAQPRRKNANSSSNTGRKDSIPALSQSTKTQESKPSNEIITANNQKRTPNENKTPRGTESNSQRQKDSSTQASTGSGNDQVKRKRHDHYHRRKNGPAKAQQEEKKGNRNRAAAPNEGLRKLTPPTVQPLIESDSGNSCDFSNANSNSLSQPRPFSNYLDKCSGLPAILPPGVSVYKGPIWRVWTVDLYKANVCTFCPNYLRGQICKWSRCLLEHDEPLRQAVYRANCAKAKSNNQARSPAKKEKRDKKQQSAKPDSSQRSHEASSTDYEHDYWLPSASSIPVSAFVPLPPTKSHQPVSRKQNEEPQNSATTLVKYSTIVSKDLPKNTPAKPAPAPKSYWNEGELTAWAERNLSPKTITKMMVKYLDSGLLPPPTQLSADCNQESFHYFTQLPGEIRNQIWRIAMQIESSDVMVRYHQDTNAIYHLQAPASLLLVNRESRSLADLHWPLTLRTSKSSGQIRIHFRSDRLYVVNASSGDLLPMITNLHYNDRHSITWLAIPLRDWMAEHCRTMFAISQCAKLQKVWFVVGEGCEDMTFINTSFKGLQCLKIRIQSELDKVWKKTWKNKEPDWVFKKIPRVQFHVVHPFEAKRLGIDELTWL